MVSVYGSSCDLSQQTSRNSGNKIKVFPTARTSHASIPVDCQVLHVDGETSPSNHQQIIKSQVNNVVTKIAREKREDLRKKVGKWMKRMRKSTHL